MSLVHHKHRPVDGRKKLLVLQKNLISGEDGVKLEPLVGVAPLILPNLRAKQEEEEGEEEEEEKEGRRRKRRRRRRRKRRRRRRGRRRKRRRKRRRRRRKRRD